MKRQISPLWFYCLFTLFFMGISVLDSNAQSENLRKALNDSKTKEVVLYDPDTYQSKRFDKEQVLKIKSDELLVLKFMATPSTGYQWELPSFDENIVELVNVPLHEACENSYAPGSPVWQYIIIKPKSRGLVELDFYYQRPWEREKSRENHIRVKVKSKGAFTGKFDYTPLRPEKQILKEKDYKVRNTPTYWNWVDQGIVSAVRNQGSCGSCWAFGSVAGFEAKIKKKDNNMRDISEQYAVSCNDFGFSCGGGWWVHDLWKQYVPVGESGAGAVYEADFPYQAADLDCSPAHPHHEQIEDWAYVDDIADGPSPTQFHGPTVAQIKQKLLTWGPIPTALCIDNWNTYTGGIMSGSTTKYTNHIVLITGYDDNNQCWIIKNSWGANWGESGYCRIRYGSHLTGQYSTYLKYDKTNPRIVYQGEKFWEAIANDGYVRGFLNMKLLDAGDGFSVSSGELTQGIHYQTHNLPSGLTTKIEVVDQNKVRIRLLGQTANHLNQHDANFTVEFLDSAFASFNANEIENYSYVLNIDFFDPYKVVYENIADITCTATDQWKYFKLGNEIPMGLWYSFYYDPYPTKVHTFFLETYTKKAVTTTSGIGINDRMIRKLNYGDEISASTQYLVTGGSYGNQHRIYNHKYTAWHGQTAYVGISVPKYGSTCYGWLKLYVTSQSVTLLEYAFNEEPHAPIRAGYTTANSLAPVADFEVNKTSIYAGETVDFTDISKYSPTSWNWTFNGGTPSASTVKNPSVTYNTAGNYSVTLAVANSVGNNTKTKTDFITVHQTAAPVADFINNKAVPKGGSVQFNDASTNKPNSWSWSFNGGTPAISTEQNPVITYNTVGNYDVSLTTGNQFGTSTTTKQNAVVVMSAPTGYCSASHETDNHSFYFNRIRLAELDNKSTYSQGGYQDFTSKHATLKSGQQYQIKFGVNNDNWTGNSIGAWIDYNVDGDFNDSNEQIFLMNEQGIYQGNITVPANLVSGITRMRVRLHYQKAPFVCGADSYIGETEDYTIILNEPQADTLNPTTPTNVQANVMGNNIELTWNASTDDSGIANYIIFLNNAQVATTKSTSHYLIGLNQQTSYNVQIQARDLVNKLSGKTPVVQFTTGNAMSYCAATHAAPNNLHILQVQLNDLNNQSTYVSSGYSNYTHKTASLQRGQTYTITMSVENDHWPGNALAAWIDWNQDGDFSDSNENIFMMQNNAGYSGSFTVPNTATLGITRMRVRVHYGKTPFACGYDSYQGEAEDYSIKVNESQKSPGALTSDFPIVTSKISIVPNPAKDCFKVNYPGRLGKIHLKILNLNGELQKELDVDNNETINVRDLPAGVYIIQVKTGDELWSEKLIIE